MHPHPIPLLVFVIVMLAAWFIADRLDKEERKKQERKEKTIEQKEEE